MHQTLGKMTLFGTSSKGRTLSTQQQQVYGCSFSPQERTHKEQDGILSEQPALPLIPSGDRYRFSLVSAKVLPNCLALG